METAGVPDVLEVQEPGAVREDELPHFGIAVEEWGTGVAQDAHAAVLDRMRARGSRRAWLRVFTDNRRGRGFYERLGWRQTGERSHSTVPPHAELLCDERDLDDGGAQRPEPITVRSVTSRPGVGASVWVATRRGG
ncbi:GNAT family N-acetyltransferase [Ornithinimicrobium sediminis]|uniref:GNAT family N-acetyltransferase n=1 Tax=Ornithinimicrobium sediminis TaxID=2904603 RepID=UPI001E4C8843|nr:GNAT family N-acetyltransferase [Ornithinimicrobium sediminis]MCE0485714.1 GNAT family N-acetyltransferase [Ornithinimicrobium sediminis]